jgi:ketosteroid isomerase-like protein
MGFSGPGHNGEKIEGQELAVYVTKDGKIIEERFYW